MGLKVDAVQNPSSATVNLTLGTTGNVTVGANLVVTGTYTQTGSMSAGSFVPTSSTVPTNGVYLPSANTLAFATNSTNAMSISSTGVVTGTVGNVMLISGTSQASTSGTAIDFTGIPSWAKRVTISMTGVSTSGTSGILIQPGISTGPVATGYLGFGIRFTSAAVAGGTNNTTGFIFPFLANTNVLNGSVVLTLIGSNTWAANGLLGYSDSAGGSTGAGSVPLGATLDRVRITTGNGTDTFDAGSINIMYE